MGQTSNSAGNVTTSIEKFFAFQRCWEFWRDQKEYTAEEKKQMDLIHIAFDRLKYKKYVTETIISEQGEPVASISTSEYLLLKETILDMDKDRKMPSRSNQKMVWSKGEYYDPKVDLDAHIYYIFKFINERTRDPGKKLSFKGYYNDPINLMGSFIASRIREVSSNYNNDDLNSVQKTQENFQALCNFINATYGIFQSSQDKSEVFISLISSVGGELKKKIEFLRVYSKEVDLRVEIKSLDQVGSQVVKGVSLYLVELLMGDSVDELFHIQHLFGKDELLKQKMGSSELGKQVMILCSVPAFSFIANNLADSDQEIDYVPNLFLTGNGGENGNLIKGKEREEAIATNSDNKTSVFGEVATGVSSFFNTKRQNKNESMSEEDKLIQDSNFMKTYRDILGYLQEFSEQLIVLKRLKGLVSLIGDLAGIVKKEDILELTNIMLNTLNNLEKGINSLEESLEERKNKSLKDNQRSSTSRPRLYRKFAEKQAELASIKDQIASCKDRLGAVHGKINVCDPGELRDRVSKAISSFEENFGS